MPLVNIMLGEVIFGGVGAGMYGVLVFIILAVFIAGLMVGRTPEYLGKKIQALRREDGDAVRPDLSAGHPDVRGHFRRSSRSGRRASTMPARTACRRSSTRSRRAPGNNGSAFAGLNANTPWYDLSLGVSMLIGRFLMIVPMLAIAGQPRAQEARPALAGHVPGDDAAVHRPARRRRAHRRRADVLPGAEPRAGRRAPPDAERSGLLMTHAQARLHLGPAHRPAARCATPSASSIRGRWRATRSCSSSRSAAC